MQSVATPAVILKGDHLLAHMYADDLNTILHEFTPEDTGFMLPAMRHHLWHTFKYVITPDKWGWVTVDAIQIVGALGEGFYSIDCNPCMAG